MLLYQRPWSPDGTFCTYIAGHSAAIFIWHSSEGPERPQLPHLCYLYFCYLYLLHFICTLLYQRPWSPDGTFCTYIAGHSAAIFIWHSSEGPERPQLPHFGTLLLRPQSLGDQFSFLGSWWPRKSCCTLQWLMVATISFQFALLFVAHGGHYRT